MTTRTRSTFSPEFRLEAAQLAIIQHVSIQPSLFSLSANHHRHCRERGNPDKPKQIPPNPPFSKWEAKDQPQHITPKVGWCKAQRAHHRLAKIMLGMSHSLLCHNLHTALIPLFDKEGLGEIFQTKLPIPVSSTTHV